MKRIKYLSALLSIVMLCVACEESDSTGQASFYKNFIRQYRQGRLVLAMTQSESSTTGATTTYNTGFVLTAPESMIYREGSPEYDRLAIQNGDTDFNQMFSDGLEPATCAFADNFTEMHVVSNADWDAAHPAGTLLDDILLTRMYSYAKFIHGGYHLEDNEGEFINHFRCLNVIKKRVSELTPSDMEIIALSMEDPNPTTKSPAIIFTSAPTLAKTHTLTLTWTTVEGNVKTASITCTPEVDPALQ